MATGMYYTPLESGGEIPRSSMMNMDLGGIDSRSLSRPPGCLDGDVQLPKMLP